MIGLNPQQRFATVVMATIIVLVSLAVLVILGVLHSYLTNRAEKEFYQKLEAQKGQVEILIANRLAQVKRQLKELSLDNTVRVTLMLDAEDQLIERIQRSYGPQDGLYLFVQKQNRPAVLPSEYDGLSKQFIEAVVASTPQGRALVESQRPKLVWLFSAPMMHISEQMGTAYALYDLLVDAGLSEALRTAVDGNVCLQIAGQNQCLLTGSSPKTGQSQSASASVQTDDLTPQNHLLHSKISGFQNLYYVASTVNLMREKRRVILLMGVLGIFILAISTFISVRLARHMVNPLKEMTRKAIQISEGRRKPRFDSSDVKYWEFQQLSRAFDYMLTQLKAAEERSRYKELLENVDDAVYIFDQHGNIVDANAAAYVRLGYSKDQFFNRTISDILPFRDARRISRRLEVSSPDSPSPKFVLVTYHLKPDGSQIPVEIRCRRIVYQGQPVILNVARDISRLIEAGKALRESEERYRSVVENSNDGIMILDKDGVILYANGVLADMLGYTPSELEGNNYRNYLDEETPTTTGDLSKERSAPRQEDPSVVVQMVRKDGEYRSMKIRTNQFEDSSGLVKTVAQVMDITESLRLENEKKELEAQLNHAQKMEAVGTLAGGIAHDFNNLLMGIQGHLSVMRLKTTDGHPYDKHIEAMQDIVRSAGNLTRQLLGFARKGNYEIKPISLNRLIENSSKMFIRARKEISLHLTCGTDLWPAMVDQGQLEQVLLNLYVNAWHAMPDGGELFVQTENVRLSEEFCLPFGVDGGNYAKITVTDTGVGMDKEIQKRIFEPFFTTKEVGKGTGLGLASAYGIIKNHNGIIQVYSKKGHGTTFSIYLPAAPALKVDEVKVQVELIKNEGVVLLVDDEAEARQAENMMFREIGLKVIQARTGKEAIQRYEENSQLIDFVTLDMIMPRMTALELYRQLRSINPQVKVLLISGYSLNRKVQELIREGCNGFMQKPFDIYKLSQQVDTVLKQSSATQPAEQTA